MPPFLSSFRSKTNSLLDNITGVIPDAPPNGTFKDRSLTCRKCGNRFRDRLELSSHFNHFPNHSDYKDAFDYDSFIRPKARRVRAHEQASGPSVGVSAAVEDLAPPARSFSDAQAYYSVPEKDKENRPALLRKFPTLTNLTINPTGDQPRSPPATDYADNDVETSRSTAKAKGKQKAVPRLRRDDSFQYGQPLASSDEEGESWTGESSSRARPRRNTAQGLMSEPLTRSSRRTSTSSVASRGSDSSRQAPPLPPKIPQLDWQVKPSESLANLQASADDTASIASESSFRTAGSIGAVSEKSRLKAYYASEEKSEQALEPSSSTYRRPAKIRQDDDNEQAGRSTFLARTRHASESNLLLESTSASYDDAPPSYHELHGDTNPFDEMVANPRRLSRYSASRLNGFATVPASPVTRVQPDPFRRPRRSTNAFLSTSGATFPVTFSPFDDAGDRDRLSGSSHSNEEVYSSKSEKTRNDSTAPRPVMRSKATNVSLPPLISSSSFSSVASPSTPRTPFAFFADAPLPTSPTSLPPPRQSAKSSATAGGRSRHNSRAKSDAEPSTRCPTCFTKFPSLGKTLEHLDNSDCGAVEFESGIM